MPILLELFCGTKSVGRVFQQFGWKTFSVDADPSCKPDLCEKIEAVTFDMLPDKVDCVWLSPPCTMYSRARTTAKTPRDLEGADATVEKGLFIARHYSCPFFMENPDGLLKTRRVTLGITCRLVDYCQYSDNRFCPGYRKRTCIWTNTAWSPKRPLCNRYTCTYTDENGRHLAVAQRGNNQLGVTGAKLQQLYGIPPCLIEELIDFLAHDHTTDSEDMVVTPRSKKARLSDRWNADGEGIGEGAPSPSL